MTLRVLDVRVFFVDRDRDEIAARQEVSRSDNACHQQTEGWSASSDGAPMFECLCVGTISTKIDDEEPGHVANQLVAESVAVISDA